MATAIAMATPASRIFRIIFKFLIDIHDAAMSLGPHSRTHTARAFPLTRCRSCSVKCQMRGGRKGRLAGCEWNGLLTNDESIPLMGGGLIAPTQTTASPFAQFAAQSADAC